MGALTLARATLSPGAMGHAGGGRASTILLSLEEVTMHASAESAWLVIRDGVYDVTEFAAEHPGGKKMLLSNAGTDATALFDQLHSQTVFEEVASKYRIGALDERIAFDGVAVALDVGQPAPAAPVAAQAATVEPADPAPERLNWRIDSPFPSNLFDDSGLEAIRFKWSQVEEFTRRDDGASEEFKLRSFLKPIDPECDWLQ